MSWITITALIVIASFACAYGLGEWVALRRSRSHGDDTSAMG
jgi:hypothetical protein